MELLLLGLFVWLLSRGNLQRWIDRAFPSETPRQDPKDKFGPHAFKPVGSMEDRYPDGVPLQITARGPCWTCGGPKDGHKH